MLGLTKQTPTGLRVFDACRYIIYLTKKRFKTTPNGNYMKTMLYAL